MKKISIVVVIISVLFSCSIGSKTENTSDSINIIPLQNDIEVTQKISKESDKVNHLKKEKNKDTIKKGNTQKDAKIEIDTQKIYEESEVKRAFPSLNNSESLQFFIKEYNSSVVKEGVSGRIIYDIVVERDGSVSDVLIVKGLNPDVDKELIRVMKMFPPFSVPGKIDGVPVRSKYRASMNIR